jgi:hypothetical protein
VEAVVAALLSEARWRDRGVDLRQRHGPALGGLELFKFGYFETVRLFSVCRPALAGSGFFKKFCSRCSSNWAEIGMKNRRFQSKYKELGLENLWKCRSTPKTTNLWIKTTKNSTNLEIKIRGNFGAIFWIFEIYGGNHKQE